MRPFSTSSYVQVVDFWGESREITTTNDLLQLDSKTVSFKKDQLFLKPRGQLVLKPHAEIGFV